MQKLRNAEIKQQFHATVHDKIAQIYEDKGETYTKSEQNHNSNPRTVHIYTDGGCLMNENNTDRTPAGWGVHINDNNITEL